MKNKTIKKGGVLRKTKPKRETASQKRGFDSNNLDEKSKGFLDLFNLPRKTANDKITFLNNSSSVFDNKGNEILRSKIINNKKNEKK